jgi:protein phosphatase 1 regulatory subunit 7
LGDRKLTTLLKFKEFPNLEVVWLNHNNLESLEGLEHNFRIKHIFAQENNIKNVDRIFETLKYVETLVLYDNELRDLERLIKNFKELKNLKHLDLFNNPAAHEPNYKQRVIYALPTLEILDKHKISYQEKIEAEVFMVGKKGTKGKRKKRE